MGDDDECARPAVEVVLDHRQGVDVEVVGGLVEQQDVGLGQQQPENLKSPPLAAGQVVKPGGQPVAGETEVFQQRAGARLGPVASRACRRTRSIESQYPFAASELLHALAQVADPQRLAAFDPPDVRRQVTGQQS